MDFKEILDFLNKYQSLLTLLFVSPFVWWFKGFWDKKVNKKQEHDKKVIRSFLDQIPNHEEIEEFFNNTDFRNPFRLPGVINQFKIIFNRFLQDPSLSIHDKTLHNNFLELKKLSDEIIEIINMRTFFQEETFALSVKRLKYGNDIDDFQTGEELNSLTESFFFKYKEFVKYALSKFSTI